METFFALLKRYSFFGESLYENIEIGLGLSTSLDQSSRTISDLRIVG